MKFFLLILSWLLLVDNLQGSTLSREERPVRTLNTTLRTNFSGVYQRKNPCSDSELETSSYKASQEFHHHTNDDCWNGYTHTCSAIIRNFLQSIANLIGFNHEPNGCFNFYLNTSISQKQRVSDNHKSCESLPTIVIEATECKIPLNTYRHVPKARTTKNHVDRLPKDQPLPSTDPSAPQNFRTPRPAFIDQTQREAFSPEESTVSSDSFEYTTPEYATQYSQRERFEAEENSCENDDFSLPSTPAYSSESPESEDFSRAVLYDLPRDTQPAQETKYFKTSLKLSPQTDPENGTIKPRIHYMAANLVTDHPQSATYTDTENPFPQPGRPITFPESPNHPTEPTVLPIPSEYPPQMPPPTNAPSFQSSQLPDEPIPISVTSPPGPQFSFPSQTEPLTQTSSTPTDLTIQPLELANGPSDNQFPSAPLPPQSANPANYAQEMSVMQFTPNPQAFDVTSTSTPFDQNQSEDGTLPILKKRYPEDFPRQVPYDNSELPSYPPPTLNRQPTPNDFSVTSEPETFAFSEQIQNFGNRLGLQLPPTVKIDAQQISYSDFPEQKPYDRDLPSTILPPTESALFTTPVSGVSDSRENLESNGIESQTSTTQHRASLAPLSPDSSNTLSFIPVGSPVNSDFKKLNVYSDEQATGSNRSTVTTVVEETITIDEKEVTPELEPNEGAREITESISRTFVPGSDITVYELPQQSSSTAGPFININNNKMVNSQSLANPDQPISSPFPRTPENPQEVKPDAPPLINPYYSEMSPQIPDAAFISNEEPIQLVPETLSTTIVPSSFEQKLTTQYNLKSDGPPSPYFTTPMPYAAAPEQTTMNSPIAENQPPSSANAYALPMQGPSPPLKPNYQKSFPELFSTPQPVLVEEPAVDVPLVSYSDRIGQRTPPASDSFVGSDYVTTTPPQVFTDKADSLQPFPDWSYDEFPASTPVSSVTYKPESVSQLTDSPLNEQSSLNSDFENSKTPYQFPLSTSSEGISESVTPNLPSSVTPPSEMYAFRPKQQAFASALGRNFQEQSFADRISSPLPPESEINGSPEAVLPQEQFENDENGRENLAGVLSATTTSTEFQVPFQSVTPVYEVQSPEEADSQPFQAQTPQNIFFEPNSPESSRLLGSVEQLPGAVQMTTSSTPLQPLSLDSFPGSSELSDRSPTTFPPDSFSEYTDVTTLDSPSVPQYPNREFNLDRSFALPDSIVTSLPAAEKLQEITLQKPDDFQESSVNSSDEFSNLNSQQLSSDLPLFVSTQPDPFATDRPSAEQPIPPVQSLDRSIQMTPQQPPRSVPLPFTTSPASNGELVIQPLMETPELPTHYSRPLPSTDSSVPPQSQKESTSYQTTTIEETTTILNSDRFSTGSTEAPLPETSPTLSDTQIFTATSPLPPSTVAGEVFTTQQQSQLPNYRDQNPDESPLSFVPLSSQQIPAISDGPSPTLQQQLQSPQTPDFVLSTASIPTIAPETAPNYPNQENLQSTTVSETVQSQRTLEEQELQTDLNPTYSPVPPLVPTVSGANESLSQNAPQVNSQDHAQQFSQSLNSAALNTQRLPYAIHTWSRPEPPAGFTNSYNSYLRMPPRTPYPDFYPGQTPNYFSDYSQNPPPFYYQQPMPQTFDSQSLQLPPYNFPHKHQLIAQQPAARESLSSEPQFRPRFPLPEAQSITSAEHAEVAPPPYLQNISNPNGPMPPLYPGQIPNYYNHFPTEARLRPFPPHHYPVYSYPQLQPSSQPNFPHYPYARMVGMLPSREQGPFYPTMNQFVGDRQFIARQENYPILRQNFDPNSKRELDTQENADKKPPIDSQTGLSIRPETAPRPYGPPQQLPTPDMLTLSPLPPTQESPYPYTSFPGHSDYDRQNLTNINISSAVPSYPGTWNPRTDTNFINFQRNTALVGAPNRPLPDPRPLSSHETTPSNEPGEDSVSYCGRDTPLLCLFDPASRGNMTAPSYVILISKLPGEAHGEESVRVEKVYMGGGTLLNCTWGADNIFPTALYTPVPSVAAGTVTLHPLSDFA